MADKRIRTRYPVIDLLADRWSPRAFASRVPTNEALGSLFEAARLAPSAHNTQPVRFLVARKNVGDGYGRLFASVGLSNEVADIFGITKERVRQIYEHSLLKIRRSLKQFSPRDLLPD